MSKSRQEEYACPSQTTLCLLLLTLKNTGIRSPVHNIQLTSFTTLAGLTAIRTHSMPPSSPTTSSVA